MEKVQGSNACPWLAGTWVSAVTRSISLNPLASLSLTDPSSAPTRPARPTVTHLFPRLHRTFQFLVDNGLGPLFTVYAKSLDMLVDAAWKAVDQLRISACVCVYVRVFRISRRVAMGGWWVGLVTELRSEIQRRLGLTRTVGPQSDRLVTATAATLPPRSHALPRPHPLLTLPSCPAIRPSLL